MATLKYISGEPNLQTVTLTSDYTAGDGHMHLTAGHGARLPTAGDFWIRTPLSGDVLNVFKVTARSTDDLTVTCVTGYGADANRAAGTVFSWSFTGEALDQFRADLIQTGADASKVAEKAGNLYLPSDCGFIRRDSGAAFSSWGPIFPCTIPLVADFAWVNQDTATASNTAAGLFLSAPALTGNQLRILKKAATAPYIWTVGFLPLVYPISAAGVGIVVRESSSGKCVSLGWHAYNANAPVPRWCIFKWTDPDTYSATTVDLSAGGTVFGPLILLRVEDNDTNRIFSVSSDGINWMPLLSETRTAFCTGDEVGLFANTSNTSGPASMTAVHALLT